jgi:DNA-binding MarR family transcriptional regulator
MEESVSSELVSLVSLLATRLAKKAGNRLSVHGISLTEFLVLEFLGSGKVQEVTRIELADHIGMSASGITRLLLPMEKNHLVEKVKNPRDSRQSLVKLSETGRQILDEATVSYGHISDDLTANLSVSQQQRVNELLAKLI